MTDKSMNLPLRTMSSSSISTPSSPRWTPSSSPRDRTPSSTRLRPSTSTSSLPTTPQRSPCHTPNESPTGTPRAKTRAEIYSQVSSINHGVQSIALRMVEMEKLTAKIADQNQLIIETKKKKLEADLLAQRIEEMKMEEEDQGYTDLIACVNKCVILYISYTPTLSLFGHYAYTCRHAPSLPW